MVTNVIIITFIVARHHYHLYFHIKQSNDSHNNDIHSNNSNNNELYNLLIYGPSNGIKHGDLLRD